MMEQRTIKVDHELKELCTHGTAAFPMTVNHDDLLCFQGSCMACHWHEDIEIIVVRRGTVRYQIYQQSLVLTKGQALLVNSNVPHSAVGVITAMLMQDGLPMGAAILLGLLLGIVIGALLGYMIAYLKFNDWVVSYAVMGICSGVALAITEGNTIPIASQTFRLLASGRFLGIYIMIWLAILLCLLMIYLSTSTTFGYNVYSMGGSEMSARLAGIKTRRVLLITYIISGFLAAVSGILLVAKTNSASPIGGSGYEWDAIAAVLIGGTVFSGGVGRVSGCIVGAALMRTLRNGLTMIGLSPYWQTFIIGITVMIIIIADGIGERRKRVQMLKRVYKS